MKTTTERDPQRVDPGKSLYVASMKYWRSKKKKKIIFFSSL